MQTTTYQGMSPFHIRHLLLVHIAIMIGTVIAFHTSSARACQPCASSSPVTEALTAQPDDDSQDIALNSSVTLATSHISERYGSGNARLAFRQWRTDLIVSLAKPRWNAFLRLPYMVRKLRLHRQGLELASVRAFGDIEVGGGLSVLPERFFNRGNLSVQLGLSIPIGQEHFDSHGQPLPDEVQPGTGSWTPFVGLLGSYYKNMYGFRGSFYSYITTSGRFDFQVGNSYQARALFTLRPAQWVTLSAGPQYVFNERVFIDGEVEEDTGGGVLRATIGVDFHLPEGVSIFANIRPPLYEHLYGSHSARIAADFGLQWRWALPKHTAHDSEKKPPFIVYQSAGAPTPNPGWTPSKPAGAPAPNPGWTPSRPGKDSRPCNL